MKRFNTQKGIEELCRSADIIVKRLVWIILLLPLWSLAQTNNNTNTNFTNGLGASKFFNIPRGTTPPTTGVLAGSLFFHTTNGLQYYDGANWQTLSVSGGSVTSFNGRTGVVVPQAGDYSGFFTPLARTITINGVTYDLSANRTYSVGTVTSVGATAGTGINVSGSPVTSSGSITITNTAPDQTVVLNNGAGISVTGTYPNFTITNTAGSGTGTVTNVSGTSPISVSNPTTTPVISIPDGAIQNVKLANSTISGKALGTDLATLNLGYGLTGTSYNGSATTTARADTGVVQTRADFFPRGDTRYALKTRTISAGTGLSGGGDLSANRTISADTTILQTVLNFFPKGDTRYAKISSIPTQYWSRSGTTLSPAIPNDSLNIGTGIYKGHGAKSDASDGFLIEASNGTDVGRFGVANTANSSLFGALNVAGNLTGNKVYSTNPTDGTSGTDSLVVHINSTNELARISPNSYIKNQYDSPQTADIWINGAFNSGSLNVSGASIFSSTLGVGGSLSNTNTPTGVVSTDSILVKDASTDVFKRISPTAFLTPTGSGSGLSGVVLTSGTQSIAGDKTFTDNLYMSGSSSKQFIITSSSGATEIYLDRAAVSKGEIRLNTSGVSKWSFGFEESSNDFLIRNRSTSSDAFKISNSTNAISAIGSISSTPQGTLYGTATGSVTSAQLATSLTDETGTGSAVFSASPTFTGTVTGTDGHFSGSFGIGITPTFPLHVSKNAPGNYVAQFTNTNTTAGQSNGLFINAGTNGSDRALNINNAANTLTLMTSYGNGDFEIGGSNATKASGTAWINPSDLRLKMNVGEYSKGLAEVLAIKPKTWYFNHASGFDTTKKHLSPIAQELKEIMPEMVSTYKGKLNGKYAELLQVDASDMTWLLVKAIQEQQAIIEKLNERILALEKK